MAKVYLFLTVVLFPPQLTTTAGRGLASGQVKYAIFCSSFHSSTHLSLTPISSGRQFSWKETKT